MTTTWSDRAALVVFVALFSWAAFAAPSADVSAAPTSAAGRIEAAFVLDTTGSMGGLIAAAKEKVWAIANAMATADPAPAIKMGLVGYRDRGDDYVTKVTDLKDDLDAVYGDLMALQAGGGGDSPESVNQALNEAVRKLAWSKEEDVYKVIFLVGDCPPHMDYQDDVKYQVTCKEAAERGITINTIQCGNYGGTEPVWSEIARLAEGKYFKIEQGGGIRVASTPYDEKLSALSRDMDSTRAWYGTKAEQAAMRGRADKGDALAAGGAPTATAERAVFNAGKAGARNFAGRQELITEIADGRLKLGDLKEAELPEEMQKMTAEEREAYVKEQLAKRAATQAEIERLAKERDEYVKAEMAKLGAASKDSFDAVVRATVVEQAAKHNINYK